MATHPIRGSRVPAGDRLGEETVHVRYAWTDGIEDAALDRCFSLLDGAEHARMESFRFPSDRRAYLVAHTLLRRTLSDFGDVAPGEWRFVSSEHGRPELDRSHASRIRFNLSHTRRAVACAVALDRDIGIDVESPPAPKAVDELAAHAFSSTEQRDLASREGAARRRRFVEMWTLKEAYVKARGDGLRVPLDAFTIGLGEPTTIRFDECIEDDPHGWQFEQRWLSPDQCLAVAVRRSGSDLGVVVTDATATLA
jgi:4'-phosphopantetheinyl transferase